eukprot:gene16993-18705_t
MSASELKFETREDEEQGVKFDETIELLLAAGYFRARIKGLSPFDKIVGGMVWCITTCDFDIDVDLLFQENSTIGQKIALTEKIVAVLPRMKCPHRIEPHQIQGLDFIHIYPVVQWLVKRAIETREELGDKIREYSLMQFHKNHSMPQDEEYRKRLESATEAVKTVKGAYKPQRVFKKPLSLRAADEETQVQSTLLEYGKQYGFSKQAPKSEKDDSMQQRAMKAGLIAAESSVAEDDSEEAYLQQQQKLEELMAGMSGADMKEILSSHAVGSLVGLQSEEIAQMAEEYATRQAQLQQESSALSKIDVKQTHARQVAALKKGVTAEEKKLEDAKEDLKECLAKLEAAKKDHEKSVAKQEELENALKEVVQQEQGQSKSVLEKLRALVAMNETIKKQEQEFRAHCKEEMVQLQEKIEKIKTDAFEGNDEESERVQQVIEQLDKDKEKLQKIRLLAAKRNRDIASLQLKIDDVPSRAELAQYQQRFIELYKQVAATHKETKQFYTLYNTLDDTKLYLEKEVSLLNSIHDSFEQALQASSSSKDQFLEQMENILKGVMRNKDNVDKKKRNEKIKRDMLNDQHLDILDQQRLYFKSIREFKEECRKSEMIQAKLEAQ